jgi:hypothetical protein
LLELDYLGIALARENTDTSDSVQGVTTDGAFWYIVANADEMGSRQ